MYLSEISRGFLPRRTEGDDDLPCLVDPFLLLLTQGTILRCEQRLVVNEYVRLGVKSCESIPHTLI